MVGLRGVGLIGKVLASQIWVSALNPLHPHKKSGRMTRAMGRQDRRIPGAPWPTGIARSLSSRPMKNPVSKEADNIPEDGTWAKAVVCVSTPVNSHTHTHALHMHHTGIYTFLIRLWCSWDWGYSPLISWLVGMHKDLGFIPSTKQKRKDFGS